MNISLILASFQRAHLLNLGLTSILRHKIDFPLEIIVVNDGQDDETESVVNSFKDRLNIKYFFSGQRNELEIKRRSPVFANNIGIKKASGQVLVLACPEMFHVNNCIELLVSPLYRNKKYMTIPASIFFDNTGEITSLLESGVDYGNDMLTQTHKNVDDVYMPFLMGVYKQEIMDIGGYDEDLIGYSGDDNDLVRRLQMNGCRHFKVPAASIHLYHGPRNDGHEHWENPDWVYNKRLYDARAGQKIRNIGREWGVLEE